MTNASSNATKTNMTTLDKMWKKVSKTNEDIDMENAEEKEAKETTEDNITTEENKNNDNDEANDLITSILRLKLKASSVQEAINQHKKIISTIQGELKICRIVQTDGKITELLQPEKLTYNETGKHNKFFVVIHGIASNNTYLEIKRNKNIFETLKTTNCYMQQHVWDSSDWDIVNVGFLSGASPHHQTKTTIKQQLSNSTKSAPTYELGATAIKVYHNNRISNTYAYEVKQNPWTWSSSNTSGNTRI